jgi:hypothetical protein
MKKIRLLFAVVLLFLCCQCMAHAYPTIDVKVDCGAVGDGVTNDTAAFQSAAVLIMNAGGGKLNIPTGTYLVGKQTHTNGVYPYYQQSDVFPVNNLNMLTIEGNNSTLKMAAGLRFGSFDPYTGVPHTPSSMPFVDPNYGVGVGSMLAMYQCNNVTIQNLTLDGNSGNLVLGGEWGDGGRQLFGYGLWLYNNNNVQVTNVHTHHQALDGIIVAWTGMTASDPAKPHTLTNVVSEYNARQGLSWVGGRGLSCYNCKFNHTGRGAFWSGPGAGLDIEAEVSVCRDGYFENCEFIDNLGAGMFAEAGDGGYATFKGCTFWGTTGWSIWCHKPDLNFEDCFIYGDAVHTFGSTTPNLATSFLRCAFEDKPWTNGQVTRTGFLLSTDEAVGDNVKWEGCTFTANAERSVWIGNASAPKVLKNCTFTHKSATIPSGQSQCVLNGTTVTGCRFKEGFPGGTTANYSIDLGSVTVQTGAGIPSTIVDGPRVKWRVVNTGLTGTIPAGLYNS